MAISVDIAISIILSNYLKRRNLENAFFNKAHFSRSEFPSQTLFFAP